MPRLRGWLSWRCDDMLGSLNVRNITPYSMGSQVITDLHLAGINYARNCTPYARQNNHFVADKMQVVN